jgi:methylenetetrahydrofolate reductase (NADPH)
MDKDPIAGVGLACDLAVSIRNCGAFDGLHLVPGTRHREVALRLESEFA